MNERQVVFVGAGPGAPDLITLRGLRELRAAEVVVYAGSLVNEELLSEAAGAELHNSARMTLDEVMTVIENAWRAGRRVVRLHTGDPAMYGAVAEQYRVLEQRGIPCRVVPGVSSVFAAAAELKVELTAPEVSQSVILTRDAGRTPVPESEALDRLGGGTVCLFLSAAGIPAAVAKLLKSGRSAATPAAVVYRASWPDQQIVRGTLADIADKAAAANIRKQAIVIVGEVLGRGRGESRLYGAGFAHGYRCGDAEFCGSVAIFALTAGGACRAAEIAAGLDAVVLVPEKLASCVPELRRRCYPDGTLAAAFREAFGRYDALVLVGAAGIAVRLAAECCRDKLADPALAVVDEAGNFAVSLLSGHLGGANALARRIAGITGGRPVITTATDGRGIMAIDELARMRNWRILNPRRIVEVSSRMLAGEAVDLLLPEEDFECFYAALPHVRRVVSVSQMSHPGAVLLAPGEQPDFSSGALYLARRKLALGIGCRRGVAADELENAALAALAGRQLDRTAVACLASAEVKSEEPGLRELAARWRVPLRFFGKEELNRVEVPNPGGAAERKFGIRSVAEASALLASGGRKLLLEKQKFPRVTIAVAAMEETECGKP